jgi:ribosomal protein L25 (general stress protein Ctc)
MPGTHIMKTSTITKTASAGVLGLALLLTAGAVPVDAFGQKQDQEHVIGVHEQIKEAIETEDYDLFVELTENAPFADQLSPEMFEIFIEIHEAHEAGDRDRVQELRNALGIEMPGRHEFRNKKGHNTMSEQVKEAIENEDYDAFIAATENISMAYEIDEEEFNVLIQAHQLRAEGDREGARDLLEDAGIERPGARGQHKGSRMRSFDRQ